MSSVNLSNPSIPGTLGSPETPPIAEVSVCAEMSLVIWDEISTCADVSLTICSEFSACAEINLVICQLSDPPC